MKGRSTCLCCDQPLPQLIQISSGSKSPNLLTLEWDQSFLVVGMSFSSKSRTSWVKPRFALKCPRAIAPKILSMEVSEGNVELKMQKCRFNRDGISFRPPPKQSVQKSMIILPLINLKHSQMYAYWAIRQAEYACTNIRSISLMLIECPKGEWKMFGRRM